MSTSALFSPLPDDISTILWHDTHLLELGAGDGLLAQELRSYGASVIAVDPNPRGPGVLKGDHVSSRMFPNRSILICWPPDGTDISDWLKHTSSAKYLFLIGVESRFIFTTRQKPILSRSVTSSKIGCTLSIFKLKQF